MLTTTHRNAVWCYVTFHKEMGWGGMDWIDLAEDKDRWRVLVKAVMNFRLL